MDDAAVHALLIGQVLRLLRLRRGWTPQHLARRARLRPSLLVRLEVGRYEATVFDVQLLAAALEMREADFHALARDAWRRATLAAQAALACGNTPWWEAAHRVTGLAGVRGLVLFAVGAAVG